MVDLDTNADRAQTISKLKKTIKMNDKLVQSRQSSNENKVMLTIENKLNALKIQITENNIAHFNSETKPHNTKSIQNQLNKIDAYLDYANAEGDYLNNKKFNNLQNLIYNIQKDFTNTQRGQSPDFFQD